MKYKETLVLESEVPINPEFLIVLSNSLRNINIETSLLNVDFYCLEQCQKMLLERGSSYILSLVMLREAVLPKMQVFDDRDLLVRTLSGQLSNLNPSKNLIIVDPYFFPTRLTHKAYYLALISEIFSPIIPKIDDIRFITGINFDKSLFQAIKAVILDLNHDITIKVMTTDDFHDRMWIVDETKGMFIGTSLNGIGRKYALTDYIEDEDVTEILDALGKLSLL